MAEDTSIHILVADDNPVDQMKLTHSLEQAGCQVSVAANGVQVLEMVEILPIDLILMDCRMPKLDGYETTRRVRCLIHEVASVPIIGITAYARYETRDKCLAAGMNDYLQKPISDEALQAILTTWTAHYPSRIPLDCRT